MTVAVLASERFDAPADQTMPFLRLVVLARLGCVGGANRAELVRDLVFAAPLAALRSAIDVELAALVRAGLVAENRARFSASDAGHGALTARLGGKWPAKHWTETRDQRLVAKALALETSSPARLKALTRPDALRGEIVMSRYGFKLRGAISPARLRSELALVALGRAFGDGMKAAGAARSGLNPKMARLLAAQLLASPRDVGTDSRLVALLAAEAVGAPKIDADALRSTLLRQAASGSAAGSAGGMIAGVTGRAGSGTASVVEMPAGKPAPAPRGATPSDNLATEPPRLAVAHLPEAAPRARPPAAARPGLEGFARAVNTAAATVADGWPGNRRAMIARVWTAIEARHPEWGLSAVEFKAMLAEAHRTGHLVLATADLKGRDQVRELQASAISYKNTVWHLVRVQE